MPKPTFDDVVGIKKSVPTFDNIIKTDKLPFRSEQPDEPVFPFQGQDLIRQLSGRLPSEGPLYPVSSPIAGAGPIGPPSLPQQEIQRRDAYKKLTDAGYTDEQLNLLMGIQKAQTPKVFGQAVGGTIGSIAFPAILGQIPPFTALPEEAVTIPISMAIFGAGVGGAAGKAAQIGIQEERAPTARELFRAGAEEMTYEAGGRLVFGGLKLAFSSFIKKTLPEAANLVDDFAKKTSHFTPAQIDKRGIVKAAEAVSRGGFISQNIFKGFDDLSQARIILYADDVVDSMGKGFARNPTEAGEMLLDMIARPGMGNRGKGKILSAFDDLIRPLYAQVDKMTKTASVSTKGLKEYANDLISKDTKLKKLYLSATGRSKLTKVADLPDYVRFGDMQDLRSSFLADVRKLSRDADKADAILKQVAKLSDEALFDPKASIALSAEAKTLLKNTNALYKTSKEVLENTFPYKLAKQLTQYPATATKIFQPKDAAGIKNVRLALTKTIKGTSNPEGEAVWNQLRQQWLSQTIEDSIKNNQINRVALERALSKMGTPALEEMFGPEELARVNKITSLLEITQKTSSQGTVLFTKGLQIGAVSKAAWETRQGDYLGATLYGALALSPIAYAKLAIHPLGAKLLTAGIKIPPGSERLGPLAARMIRVITEVNAEREKADKKMQMELQLSHISPPAPRELGGFGGRGF